MLSAEQLSRTILLLRTDLLLDDPNVVLRALTTPSILLVADESVMSTLSGQVALTTSAMLMARSGHSVFIDAPDAELLGHQPPLIGGSVHEAVTSVGDKLIDGVHVSIGCPLFVPDIAFIFGGGNAGIGVRAKRLVSVGWSEWAGELRDWPLRCKPAPTEWPMGAMAAAVLVAAEAMKLVGIALARFSPHGGHYRELFAPSKTARLSLAPESTPKVPMLGDLDIISAGAVSNAFLYALLRLPRLQGNARAFDRDRSEPPNRNRNVLLLPDFERLPKVDLFEHFGVGLTVTGIPRHFEKSDLDTIAERVAVGVDDLPTRWMLAGARVSWMGVGATSHFNSMASVHYPYAACAACLHPHDEPMEGDTPTIAFVSFLAGLLMAADLLRDVGRSEASLASRYRYLTPLQLCGDWEGPVAPTAKCPAGCPASRLRAS